MIEALNKEKNFVSVLCYSNGAEDESDLITFLSSITEVMKNYFTFYEIICVYDGPSVTSNLKSKIHEMLEMRGGLITIVNMSYPQGMEKASQAGLDIAIGDFIIEFDSLSCDYPAELVMQAFKTALQGHDIVSVRPKLNSSLLSSFFYKLFVTIQSPIYKNKI